MPIVNIAAYKFSHIPDPQSWVEPLKAKCDHLELRGTIVLAVEGINLFLAGTDAAVDAFMTYLREDQLFGTRFLQMEQKYSASPQKPFKKMVVRVAREIITMRQPMIDPEARRAPAVDALTLRRWLETGSDDEGRPVVMLDTRNAFEVEIGTFENALVFDIEKFSQFPAVIEEAVSDSALALKEKTIVSFCTGGIRCEKAALFMQKLDIPHIYQLDGGILRYFEEAGGAHWQGECFVFDERVAVDTALQPTTKTYEGRGN